MNLVSSFADVWTKIIVNSGKGTAPVDGMALLAACVRHFNLGSTRVLIALHFYEIFTPEIINFNILTKTQAFKMAVYTETSDSEIASTYTTPLYKLQLGLCDDSGGMRCAKSAGMKTEVLERASVIQKCLLSNLPFPQKRRHTVHYNSSSAEILKIFLGVSNWKNVNDVELNSFLSLVHDSF